MKKNKWYGLALITCGVAYLLTAWEGTGFLIMTGFGVWCFFDESLIDD